MDLMDFMMLINRKKNRVIFFILVILVVVPFLVGHDYNSFFHHPFQKTDIFWKEPYVNCIKESVGSSRSIQLIKLIGNEETDLDVYSYYLYQYLFSPIILDVSEKELNDEFVVIFEGIDQDQLQQKFPNYKLSSCPGNMFYLQK